MTAPAPNAYLRTKIVTSGPAELRLMLLDGAIRFAEQARAALPEMDYEAAYTGLTRCQNILLELINGLKPEHDPALCERLSSLYTFMYLQLVKASSARDPALVDDVIKLLHYERETWRMLLDQLAAENNAAKSMEQTPAAKPLQPPNAPPPQINNVIGGSVSVRG
jgi:flagellar protein FliS